MWVVFNVILILCFWWQSLSFVSFSWISWVWLSGIALVSITVIAPLFGLVSTRMDFHLWVGEPYQFVTSNAVTSVWTFITVQCSEYQQNLCSNRHTVECTSPIGLHVVSGFWLGAEETEVSAAIGFTLCSR